MGKEVDDPLVEGLDTVSFLFRELQNSGVIFPNFLRIPEIRESPLIKCGVSEVREFLPEEIPGFVY